MGEEQKGRIQKLVSDPAAKDLFTSFRFYNEKMHDFARAAANALNHGEAVVDGWMQAPSVAEAGKLVCSMAIATS